MAQTWPHYKTKKTKPKPKPKKAPKGGKKAPGKR